MTLTQLIARVRAYTNEKTTVIFTEAHVTNFLNEGIDRIQIIPELVGMDYLVLLDDVPALLPARYHYMLSVYATARCFEQDERHYEATNKMNEFETKLEELQGEIANGNVTIVDGDGNAVTATYNVDYVQDTYFAESTDSDDDSGVEGL